MRLGGPSAVARGQQQQPPSASGARWQRRRPLARRREMPPATRLVSGLAVIPSAGSRASGRTTGLPTARTARRRSPSSTPAAQSSTRWTCSRYGQQPCTAARQRQTLRSALCLLLVCCMSSRTPMSRPRLHIIALLRLHSVSDEATRRSTRRGRGCTSATPRGTPPATSWRGTSGCKATTSCTRWVGTRSASQRSSTRLRRVSNGAFWGPFLYTNHEMIILPRQARDKHRKTRKRDRVLAGTHPAATTASNIDGFRGQLQVSTAEESVSIIYIRRDIRACKSAARI